MKRKIIDYWQSELAPLTSRSRIIFSPILLPLLVLGALWVIIVAYYEHNQDAARKLHDKLVSL